MSLLSRRRVTLVTGVGVSLRASNRSNISSKPPFWWTYILISYRPSEYSLNGKIRFFDLIGLSHGFEQYKDFLITSSTFATGCEWNAQGVIFRDVGLVRLQMSNASKARFLTARRQRSSTALSCAKSGSTSGLDALPAKAL